MARRFTVSRLLDMAKSQADMENSDQLSDAAWKELLSSAYSELHEIVSATGARYFETIFEFSSASMVAAEDGKAGAINLPDDIMSTIGVDRRQDGRWFRIVELMLQERNALTALTTNRAVAFALVEDELRLYPKPASGQTYRIVYVPQPADLGSADDAFSVDVITPYAEKFIVWNMAFHALAKKEEEGSILADAKYKEYRAHVEEWATKRMLTEPRRHIVHEGPSFDSTDGWDEGGWRFGR